MTWDCALRGEQLAAGVRFVRLVKEGAYDLVVANPPYQGTSKMADSKYVETQYPLGKADLYAAFLLRGLQLVRRGGVSAMLTMRNWMFIKQYAQMRECLLETFALRALGDFEVGAFEEVGGMVVSVCVSVLQKTPGRDHQSVALKPTFNASEGGSGERTHRKRAATLCHVGRHLFEPAALKVVPEWPVVYWWDDEFLADYAGAPKFGELFEVRQGLCTGNNTRTLRFCWELTHSRVETTGNRDELGSTTAWLPFMKGGESRAWVEPLLFVVNWQSNGLEIKVGREVLVLAARPQNESYYLTRGVAVQTTGSDFSGRMHRYASIFGDKARSVFPDSLTDVLALLNAATTRSLIEALNPTIDFTVGDLKRVPFTVVADSDAIMDRIVEAFTNHEAHREPSVEFSSPGPSPWRHAQEWAQTAVDRPEGEPLPPYVEELDPEPPTDYLSFALGVALGRFGPNSEGILDPTQDELSATLRDGICFLDGTLDTHDRRDSLGHPSATPLHTTWSTHGPAIDARNDLRTYLRLKFFGGVHKGMYENRPIHWPLCSEKKTFVAWVNIHRFSDRTLRVLLADHLHPALTRLEGQLTDLRAARDGADKRAAREAERRFDAVLKSKNELFAFIEMVHQCGDKGPPPTDPDPKKCPTCEVDARYAPDLDDGVMINSAALWPLLEPLWKDPKKWWTELALAKASKDYDWAHLSMRYWPTRVDAKCQKDPSLGVALGCFWAYHPARAWAWELRLQNEIGPDFRIEESSYRGDGGDAAHRAAYLRDHPEEALASVEKEALRRRGRGKDAKPVVEMTLLEPGLWSALPAECWALEDRIIEKQEAPFRLRAPDEPEARAACEAKDPSVAQKRRQLAANSNAPDMFDTETRGSAP